MNWQEASLITTILDDGPLQLEEHTVERIFHGAHLNSKNIYEACGIDWRDGRSNNRHIRAFMPNKDVIYAFMPPSSLNLPPQTDNITTPFSYLTPPPITRHCPSHAFGRHPPLMPLDLCQRHQCIVKGSHYTPSSTLHPQCELPHSTQSVNCECTWTYFFENNYFSFSLFSFFFFLFLLFFFFFFLFSFFSSIFLFFFWKNYKNVPSRCSKFVTLKTSRWAAIVAKKMMTISLIPSISDLHVKYERKRRSPGYWSQQFSVMIGLV